jgi:hypothetical protein
MIFLYCLLLLLLLVLNLELLNIEVHTGDKHHYMAKDIKGVRIQQMPSLSGADRWHADLCKQCRAALMLHYNYRDGKIGV